MIVQICLGVKFILDKLPSDCQVKCAEISVKNVYLSQSGLVKIYEPFEAVNSSSESSLDEYFAKYQQDKRLSSTAPEQVNP